MNGTSRDDSLIAEIYNFRPVCAHLSTSGQPTAVQLRALAHNGYQTIINLAVHDDPRYSLPDEAGLVQSLGMEYVHIPIPFDQPAESHLLDFFEAMDDHAEKIIHVHCAANMRVSALLGLYNRIVTGQETDTAFALMRSLWEPDSAWTGFINSMLDKYRT